MAMEAVTSPEAAVASVAAGQFDLLLMDLNYTSDTTSGREGIDLLTRVQERDSLLPIIVMTGWGSVDLAVEAMRARRPGLRAEAVGQRAARHHAARRNREGPRVPAQARALEQREHEEARRIQRKLLPASMPEIDGCEISASWQPASGVGGDCFDAIAFGRPRARALDCRRRRQGDPRRAADVESAGRRPRVCDRAAEPADALSTGQPDPVRQHRRGPLHQLLLLHVDTDLGVLTFANAGHYPPILVRADGSVERLTDGGPVLGVFRTPPTLKARSDLAAATAWSSSRTASPEPPEQDAAAACPRFRARR